MQDLNKSTPILSIGMPVYNSERFIRDAIDSLLAQTFQNYEIIISDNASTDMTEAICLAYAKSDSRIRYVRQANNIGAAANFDYLLKNAGSADYFMWAASDDSWSVNWIESLINNFGPDDVGLFGCYREEGGEVIKPPTYLKGEYVRFFLDSDRTGKCLYSYSIFKTNKLNSINKKLYDSPIGGDQLFLLNLLSLGSLRSISKEYLSYRIHDESESNRQQRTRSRIKTVLSRYPFIYYLLACRAVPLHLKTVMPAVIVWKYFAEQVPLFIGLVQSVIRRSLRFFFK